MGGNLIESQRAVIALFWPAGAGADGTAVLVNISSRRSSAPTATFAPDGITLKSKLIFSFTILGIIGQEQTHFLDSSPIISPSSQFVLTLGFKQPPARVDFITISGKIGFLNCGRVSEGKNGTLELFCQLSSVL